MQVSLLGSYIPVKNCLARNMQILQVFFLQDLQDLALNLASLALKMKLFLQDMKNLARIFQEKYLQDLHISCKMVFYWDTIR